MDFHEYLKKQETLKLEKKIEIFTIEESQQMS